MTQIQRSSFDSAEHKQLLIFLFLKFKSARAVRTACACICICICINCRDSRIAVHFEHLQLAPRRGHPAVRRMRRPPRRSSPPPSLGALAVVSVQLASLSERFQTKYRGFPRVFCWEKRPIAAHSACGQNCNRAPLATIF